MTTYNFMTIEIGIHDGDAIGWFDNEEWKGPPTRLLTLNHRDDEKERNSIT